MTTPPRYAVDCGDLSSIDAQLSIIPEGKPGYLYIVRIQPGEEAQVFEAIWRWAFLSGVPRDLAIEWETADLQVQWDIRRSALVDEHRPGGMVGLLNDWVASMEGNP